MKNRKKINILHALITIFIFTMLNTSIVANAADKNYDNIDLVILFNDNTIDENVKDIIINSGGKIIEEYSEIGGIEVECTSNLIPTITSEDSVQSLSPTHVIKISNEKSEKFIETKNDSNNLSADLYENYQWDIKRVTNNGESYKLESGSHNVVVGILDSGVDTTHHDLVNNFLGGKNFVPSKFQGDSSETGDLDDVYDRLGHGTNVTGIIAANGRIKGVAPNIGYKSYRIFDKLASYSNYGSNFIDISSPGGDLLDTYDIYDMCLTTDINSQYTLTEGTSMATPKVTAVAALIICQDNTLTPKEVAKKMYKTADVLDHNKSSKCRCTKYWGCRTK